jgi:hypothetical protein
MLKGTYHATQARTGRAVDMADSPDDSTAAPVIRWDCVVRQLIEQCRKHLLQVARAQRLAL